MTRTTHLLRHGGWLLLAAWSLTRLSAGAEPPPVEVDFCQAAGITPERLAALVSTQLGGSPHGLVLAVTLHNAADACLVRGDVTFRWDGGQEKVSVAESGVIALPLEPARLPQLTILAPRGYTRLRQFTFPEGSAYVPPPKFAGFGDEVRDDAAINLTLHHGRVSRYNAALNLGQYAVVMAITAEFTGGSSGGPVFAADGSVAGLTTSRRKIADGLIVHQCVPARAIRALLENTNGGPPGPGRDD